MSEVEDLKTQEAALYERVDAAAQALLDLAGELRQAWNEIIRAGGQAVEYSRFKDMLPAARLYLDERTSHERIQAHAAAKAQHKQETLAKLGRTYTLKGR